MIDAVIRGAGGYVGVLRVRRARVVAVGGLVGRFREAGTGLALVLVARGAHGSFGVAGGASAAYLAGAAITRPAHGRWVDRAGARWPLLIASAVNAGALAAVAVAAGTGTGVVVLLTLSAVVGVSLPALSASLRSMWPRLVPDAGEHAYALDTLSYELSLILSPALVGLVAVAAGAWVSLLVIAVLGVTGTSIVAVVGGTGEVRDRGHDRSAARFGGIVWALVVVSLFVGAAEGSMTVLAPGVAAARDAHAGSGLLLSALSAGSLLGALSYGALSVHGTLGGRLAGFTVALAIAFVAVGLFGDTIAGFALSAALTGLVLSPALTAGFVAIQRASAPGSLAETFTWASFAAAAGAAACQALCGVLISGPGIKTALWLPAAISALAAAVAFTIARVGPELLR